MSENCIFSPKEKNILKELAKKIAELASRPIEEEKTRLWYAHNNLETTRPLVFCDPEHGWTEIFPQKNLECENEWARLWEYFLKKEIFWGKEMKDDRVIEPYFNVAHVYSESDWGMHETKIGGGDGGSYTWESPLKSYNDIGLLHYPKITIDHDLTGNLLDIAHDLFDGILKVRLKTGWWWSLGMTWTLVNLRGMQQIMFDMIDQPDNLHKLMSFLSNGTLAKLDFLEKNNLLSLNSDGTYVGSGGFGWTKELPKNDFNGTVRTNDMWGFCESQETVGVGPDMFKEFILTYQLPILKRFGLTCYGCCEPLNERWEVLKQIPNLRRVSVSPFSDVPDMAEKLGSNYIFSLKPTPNDIAAEVFDESIIRKRLSELLKITKDCRVEIIMKDTHTIQNDPERVKTWVRIAKEEAEGI
jgi:hypothetical protein